MNKGFFSRPDIVKDKLYVITAVFNPQRYRTRWSLYKRFEQYILNNKEAHLVTVEYVFGQREEALIEDVSENHTVIHLRGASEFWAKENLLNIGIQHLPEDWKYVAWIDADVSFIRPDWVGETIQQLQHYQIVQMFQLSIDVDPTYIPFSMSSGFVNDWINGVPDYGGPYQKKWKPANTFHTGYAWAARKEALRNIGGLLDWAILGSSDNHFARCLVGQWEGSVNRGVHKEYKELLKIYQERCLKYINKNIGYVPGSLIHYFHGAKENRRYKDRWKILVEHQFQPSKHLKRDWNGLYQLTDENPELVKDIREYFRQRNEDDLDMKGIKNFLQK